MAHIDEPLEAPSGAKAFLILAAVFVAALMLVRRTGQDTTLQAQLVVLALLVLPAYIMAQADSKYLVPYLVFVWAVAPEARRIVDWMQGGFHPQSYIAVAPPPAS